MMFNKKTASKSCLLVGDIGGTNARFALVDNQTGELRSIGYRKTADFEGILPAIEDYLSHEGDHARPTAASIAVACPTYRDDFTFTNNHWRFSKRELKQAMRLDALHIINDFTAQALAIPHLDAEDIRPIGPDPQPASKAAIGVLGPGTGLGVSGLIPDGLGNWSALSGEGGHAGIAPETELEMEILRLAWKEFGRTSAERLLCGNGIAFLYHALAAIRGQQDEDLSEVEVTTRAISGNCDLCRETIHQFCALLGGFAGDLALVLGARGGIYIAGGIVPRFGSLLESSPFRARFEGKGRFAEYNNAIPTYLVVPDENPALLGAASVFKQGVNHAPA